MKRVAVIQARMGSERLPGKVLKTLAGQPVLQHIVNILQGVSIIDEIVIATTTLRQDDAVEQLAEKNSVRVIRGSANDVLDRFRLVVLATKPDLVIRVTGDDPLMDNGITERVIAAHAEGDWDYSSNILTRTYPRGMDTEVVTQEVLAEAWRETADQNDREHVTLYIRDRGDVFRLHNVAAQEMHNRPELRLCLDTPNDYELISNVYDNLYNGLPIKLVDVIEYLDAHPEVKKLNAGIMQKKVRGKDY
ncbi:cytidylyltransferase domain-containing protein [Thermodesulfobacteriota bacterium]